MHKVGFYFLGEGTCGRIVGSIVNEWNAFEKIGHAKLTIGLFSVHF